MLLLQAQAHLPQLLMQAQATYAAAIGAQRSAPLSMLLLQAQATSAAAVGARAARCATTVDCFKAIG